MQSMPLIADVLLTAVTDSHDGSDPDPDPEALATATLSSRAVKENVWWFAASAWLPAATFAPRFRPLITQLSGVPTRACTAHASRKQSFLEAVM